ncbi:MAG: glycosyltransferase family 2 protein [Phycisphaerales bacterium]|nr:glycosyltransferase family 2 protein [Phycisphaerales bacterium]
MSFEHYIYLTVFLLWLLTTVQGVSSFKRGLRFYQYVKRKVAEAKDLRTSSGEFKYMPKAVIILPCCGVDEKLEQTVAALARQNYDNYEIVFTFESATDPAHSAVTQWTKDWEKPRFRLVVAGMAENRGQKIHNLLAALEHIAEDREVLIFLDSDAIPHENWLGHLVAPLEDDAVGAATGYRWYVAIGGLAAGMRCAWNAATVSLLADEKLNFVWGGSTAIRRDRFDSLKIAERWDRALSDDYQVTRTVREAGLKIRFVPQALIASSDRTSLRGFLSFARRQVIITKICGFDIWRAGLIICLNFLTGSSAVAVLFFFGLFGWFGTTTSMYLALAGWLVVLVLITGMAALRQLGLRMVLKPPILTWRDALWDIGGTLTFAGSLHLNLVLSSIKTRRFFWRNTEYEMISPDETRILRRLEPE